MKVKELIEKLQELPQEKDIKINNHYDGDVDISMFEQWIDKPYILIK